MFMFVGIFALESNYFLTALPSGYPATPCQAACSLPNTGGRGCQAPIWAHILLRIGLEHRNSCQTGETNKF